MTGTLEIFPPAIAPNVPPPLEINAGQSYEEAHAALEQLKAHRSIGLPKVFAALPAYGQILCSGTHTTLLALQREFIKHGIDGGHGTLSYPDIVAIRNIFLTIWYDKIASSHMLFIDSDMSFAPQLVIDMLNANQPLVGALCPKKKLPIEFAGRAKVGDVRLINGHMEVAGVGGAIMLIRRDAVQAMLEKFPEMSDTITVKNHAAREILESQGVTRMIRAFDPVVIDGEKFSEDLSFCHRHTMCGGEVWANIMHKVTHIGLYEFTGCYFDQIKDHIQQHPPGTEPPPMTNTPFDAIQPAMLEPTLEAVA